MGTVKNPKTGNLFAKWVSILFLLDRMCFYGRIDSLKYNLLTDLTVNCALALKGFIF